LLFKFKLFFFTFTYVTSYDEPLFICFACLDGFQCSEMLKKNSNIAIVSVAEPDYLEAAPNPTTDPAPTPFPCVQYIVHNLEFIHF
jgi:hypothetical protein